ncbi:MAG TPA: hypothetical protein VGO62_14885 [Myxococcota bacterium]
MARFADFALLRTEPSYGGAEIVRARRILANSEDKPVHLALFGEVDRRRAARLHMIAVTAAPHDHVACILEVGTYEDTLFATATAASGVAIDALLAHERRNKSVPDLAFSLSVALQLAQLVADLHERGDVWAADGGTGLSSLFPGGLGLDALVIGNDGQLTVRALAGAGGDEDRPNAFRAPEMKSARGGGVSVPAGGAVAADVFAIAQTLRALLTADATATSAPRLPPAAASLGPVLAAGLNKNPDERFGLFMLVERLAHDLAKVAGKTKPAAVAASFLKREYKGLLPDDVDEEPMAPAAADVRARLSTLRRDIEVLWPTASPAGIEFELARPTAVQSRQEIAENLSGVERVFDDLSSSEEEQQATQPVRIGAAARLRVPLEVAAATLADDRLPDGRLPGRAPELKTEPRRREHMDKTSASDPPWVSVSEFDLLEAASAAPVAHPEDLETGPTVETRTLIDGLLDDEDDTADSASSRSGKNLTRRPR